MGNHSFKPWQLSFERRSTFLPHLTIHTKTVANTMREGPSFQTATMFTLKPNLKENRPANSAHKDMSFTSFSFCKTRHAQNPKQPRLLSTLCNSWHNMSRAMWQLKASFATSQSCRKRAIVSPDPCSPMTNNASLPTLFSSELLDDIEEPFSERPGFSSIIMCRPIKAHAFTVSTGMLDRLFLQKEEEELATRPLPGTFHCAEAVRRRFPRIQKRPKDLFPQWYNQV